MRQVNSLEDARIIIRDLHDRLGRLETKSRDMHGLKLQNAGDATLPSDYVTLKQLPNLILPTQFTPRQQFMIVFTPPDSLIVDNTFTVYRYIAGRFRVGIPVAVYLYADKAPTSDMKINILWNSNTQSSVETLLLSTPLLLPSGSNGPVVSSVFDESLGMPAVSYLSTWRPKIILGGNATGVTIQIEVLRTQIRNTGNV